MRAPFALLRARLPASVTCTVLTPACARTLASPVAQSIKPEVEGDKAWEKIKDDLPAPPVLTSVGRKLAGLESY